MRRSFAWRLVFLTALPVAAVAGAVQLPTMAEGTSSGVTVRYIAGRHLWTKAVDGGTARQISTPWPVQTSAGASDIQWSPDGRRIALDNGKNRLAVVDVGAGSSRTIASTGCTSNCTPPTFAWSPDSRYLAYTQVTNPSGSGTLRLFDTSTERRRLLLRGIAAYNSGIDWAHGSEGILVSTGTFDVTKQIFPSVTVVSLNGRTKTLGKGIGYGWSPDDRFVGAVRDHTCGANTCDDAELIYPSRVGTAIVLTNHIESTFENPVWAWPPDVMGPYGNGWYAFDRWLLGRKGHVARVMAGPKERMDGVWGQGALVTVQSYHPYYSTPDSLFVAGYAGVIPPLGSRIRLYTTGQKNSCGACSKDVYSVKWSCIADRLAFATPEYPTPKMVTVYPKFFVASWTRARVSLRQISVPKTDMFGLIGFAHHGQEFMLRAAGKIYRYSIASRKLSVVADHVSGLATPALSGPIC